MAVVRYDLRKTYEEAEANAIGTEYVRAGLLPAADAAQVQVQLRNYTDLRIRSTNRNQTNFAKSMPTQLSCKPRCGQPCRLRPRRNRRP